MSIQNKIKALAKEKNAVILAHNYQVSEVQDIADFVGDSLGLSLEAQKTDADMIIFCGVHFMAESAKVLNPDKRVFLPNLSAGCSLADSITPESLEDELETIKRKVTYPIGVVSYVNTSAEVKSMSDICCTSANAVSVIRSMPERHILFTPDKHLGAWVASKVPEKVIHIYDGQCPTHAVLRGANVAKVKSLKKDAIVIAHPECRGDVIDIADEVCSTTAMVDRVAKYPDAKTFIIATENGMLHQLKKIYPDKEFILADGCIGCRLHCPYMKMNSLENVLRSLTEEVHEIKIAPDIQIGARKALERMIAVPRD